MMEYKGYHATPPELDEELGVFSGRIVGIRDVVTFSGKTAGELKQAFAESVDDYLAFCAERGEAPNKPYSGSFPLRLPEEVHRSLEVVATATGMSMNAFASAAVAEKVAREISTVAAPARPPPKAGG